MLLLLLNDSSVSQSIGSGSVTAASSTAAAGLSRSLLLTATATGATTLVGAGLSSVRSTGITVNGSALTSAQGRNTSPGSGAVSGVTVSSFSGLSRVFGGGSAIGISAVAGAGPEASSEEREPMTNLEALTSAIGEELTLFSGFRSTRLTGPVNGEITVSAGTATSTTDGLTFTLLSGAFSAAVGDILEIQDGAYTFRTGTVSVVGGPTSVTLGTAIGGAPGFGPVGWRIIRPGASVLNVESALDWPASGVAVLNGYEIEYGSRTDTTFSSLATRAPRFARARLTFPAASGVTNGATVAVGPRLVEFRTSGVYRHNSLRSNFDASSSAAQIATGFITAITQEPTAARDLIFFNHGNGEVDIWARAPGPSFNYAVTSTGFTNAVFNALTGGANTVPYVIALSAVRDEVAEWTRETSVVDQFQNSVFIGTASGSDLDVIGNNLGVPRPESLSDAEYRTVIRLIGGSRRGVYTLIHALMNELVGTGNWDSLIAGNTPATEEATVYLARTDDTDEQSVGKAFIEAGRNRRANSTTTWGSMWTAGFPPSIPEEESRPFVYDTVFENEPVGDVFTAWNGVTFITGNLTIGADGTGTCTYNGSPTFTANAIGCKLCVLSGPLFGQTTTVTSQPAAGIFSVGPLNGYEWPTLPNSVTLNDIQFSIIRTNGIDIFRGLPDTYTGRAILGDTIATTPWTLVIEAGTVQTGDITHSTILRGVTVAPDAGDAFFYSRLIRAARESTVEYSINVQPAAFSILSGASTGRQCLITLEDGLAGINVGAIGLTGSTWQFGFVNGSGALLAGSPVSPTFTQTFPSQEWVRIRIVKPSARREYTSAGTRPSEPVELWVNGVLIGSLPYSTFVSSTPSSTAQLTFGCRDATGGYSWRFQRTDFNVRNPQSIQNWTSYNGVATGSGQLVDSTNNPFIVVQDTGRQVSIYGVNGRNAGGGTAVGRWEIATPSSTSTVTLRGVERWSGQTYGDTAPTRFIVNDGTSPFGYPHALGHTLQILNGPNAGTYTIARILRTDTFEDLATIGGTSQTATVNGHPANILAEEFSNVIEVSSAFPDPDDDTAVRFRINPVFPTTSTNAITFEIHSTVQQNSPTGTPPHLISTRRPGPTGIPGMAANTLLRVDNARVLSAQVQPIAYRNSLVSPGVYDAYPFYLWDRWGPAARSLLELCRAAGYHIDMDRLFRDASGLHVL